MNKKKKVYIADITSLHTKSGLKGHFLAVAKNYVEVLDENFDIKIAGGPIYKTYLNDDMFHLPYDCIAEDSSLKNRLITKIREMANIKTLLYSDADIIIFQAYSRLMTYLIGLLLFWNSSKKVYIIQYKKFEGQILERSLLKLVKPRISGIISGMDDVGSSYGLRYLTIPDYLYKENSDTNNLVYKKEYDFTVIGLISADKDVEQVINRFRDTEYKVLIAGGFINSEKYRAEEIRNSLPANVIFRDEYLSEEEYDLLIRQSRYIVLPYKKGYNLHSSGVVLDALMRKTPVIVSNVNALRFIGENKLGFVYEDSLHELNPKNVSYEEYLQNIESYLLTHKMKVKELQGFINKE